MEAFPFTDDEWAEVKQVTLPLVNAAIAYDALRASLISHFVAVLATLRQKYGEHPVLLETEADFVDNPVESVPMYRRAKQLAQANGLPIASISISLAAVLLEPLDQPENAREELLSCQSELASLDDYNRENWNQLMEACEIALRGA